MAAGIRFICDHCNHTIESWDDGNPYYFDEHGKKQYAYHPNHDLLDMCIGNDSPTLCLSCGKEFMIDSRSPVTVCPKCSDQHIADTFELGGKRCPYCKKGTFNQDPDYFAVS